MYRVLLIAIVLVLAMLWLGWRLRKTQQLLSSALFAAAVAIALLLIAGATGLIGG